MRFLITLWQFSRPHTIIGSTLSIIALYLIALHGSPAGVGSGFLLAMSLLSAWACNIYITGLNQWSDVEVDVINKPWLPIPAGRLSRKQALNVVIVCGVIALAATLPFHPGFTGLIFLIMAIGTAYSLPPLKFKRSHILAAAAITLVRGLLVNVGFYLHFSYELSGGTGQAADIIPLIVFVAAFSLGIAWFKDIPDTAGDAEYQFGTLAVKAGRRRAFLAGVLVVSAAYVCVIAAALTGYLPGKLYFAGTHLIALLLFWWQARALQVSDDKQVKRFYLFFWGLFFVEYIIYPLGFYLS